MPHATVEIVVEPGEPTDDGHDQVTYLLAPNPGEAARPLARAASGGELSRAMLAARVVLSEAPPTLVFDEVDAGIGGEAGVAVGRLLQTLGSRHQVLCVTHLAQVAAFAGTQVVVEKAVEQVSAARQDGGADGGVRVDRRRRRSASPSCRACSRASVTRRTPAATPPSCSRRPARPGPARPNAAEPALMARLLRLKQAARGRRDPGSGAGRPPHQGHDPAPAGGGDRGHQPPRPRPRRRRRPHREGRRRGRELRAVDLRPLPERRPDPRREAGITLLDDVGRRADGPGARRATSSASRTVRSGATASCSAAAPCSTSPASRPRWRTRAPTIGTELERFADEHARVHPEGGAAHLRAADAPAAPHQVRRPPRAGRRARARLPLRPRRAALRTSASTGRCSSASTAAPTRCSSTGSSPTSSSATSTRCRSKGLACGAELVHHVHPDGRAPGRENLLEWGVDYHEFVAEGTSEDVAMLLAYESKAQLIVAVGTHATMVEFLDKGRPGMASTFLTRLRLGPMLVDAKGVSRLYEGRVRRLDIFLLVGAALDRDARRRHRRRTDPRVPARALGDPEGPVQRLMINFRFHVVSLIAIFLALALGVVIGAGVIDRGVVDTLNSRLDRVEAKSDRIQGENNRLSTENEPAVAGDRRHAALRGERAPLGDDVGIVAVRGVTATTSTTSSPPRSRPTPPSPASSGSRTSGSWTRATTSKALQDALGSTTKNKANLRTEGWKQLAQPLEQPRCRRRGRRTTSSRCCSRPGSSASTRSAGAPSPTSPAANAGVTLVVGNEGSIPPGDVAMPLASALHSAEVPTVVAERVGGDHRRARPRRRGPADPRQRPRRHRVDGRRPRPAPGPDHRGARDGGPLPRAEAGRRALRLRRQHQAAPGPGQRREPIGVAGRVGASALVAVVVGLVALVAAAPAGAATPARGPGARHLAARPPSGPTSTTRRRRTSTDCSRSRPSVRMVTNGVDRPTSLTSGYVTAGRRGPGGRERLDRRPGLRRRRARSGATPPATCSPPAPASRPATGWCTCRSPTPSTANDSELYGAKVGLLGDELARAGIARAVVANGDGSDPSTPETRYSPWRRAAVAALMTSDGKVPGGKVDAVAVAARTPPRRSASGSIPTASCARSPTRGSPARWCWSRAPTSCAPTSRRASRRTSRRCGSAPTRWRRPTASSGGCSSTSTAPTWSWCVGPTPPSSRDALNVAAVRAPGFAPGLLRSTTTQRDGFVNLTDVAPTVLTYFGLERPDDMEGRRMETGDAGGSLGTRTEFLVNVNEDGLFRDSLIGASMGVVVGVVCGLTVLDGRRRSVAPAVARRVAGLRRAVAPRLSRRHVPRRAVPLRSQRRARRVLGVRHRRGHADRARCACSRPGAGRSTRSWSGLGTVVVLHLVDLVTGAHLEWNTVFGYSPTIGIRFVGQGNMTFSQLTAAAVLFAGLLVWRVPTRRGVRVAIGLLAVTVVVMVRAVLGQRLRCRGLGRARLRAARVAAPRARAPLAHGVGARRRARRRRRPRRPGRPAAPVGPAHARRASSSRRRGPTSAAPRWCCGARRPRTSRCSRTRCCSAA